MTPVVFFSSVSFLLHQPPGGVSQGQRFTGKVVSSAGTGGLAGAHSIPQGRWRDGLCDCFVHGCCHPVCCLGLWCTSCLLGQVQTRLKLNMLSAEITSPGGQSAFIKLFIITTAVVILSWVFSIVSSATSDCDGDDDDYYYYDDDERCDPGTTSEIFNALQSIVRIAFFIFIVVLTMKARTYIRNKYNIPEQKCNGCEDCCCAFWCGPCVTCQMARHTADFHRHGAKCCTSTGLATGVPEVV